MVRNGRKDGQVEKKNLEVGAPPKVTYGIKEIIVKGKII